MIYISIQNENEFLFRNSNVEQIEANDVPVKEEIYLEYLQREINEKFKIKNLQGSTFEEIFEEVEPEPIEPREVEPSSQELLAQQVANLAIENKKKDMAIESLVKMVADLNIKVQGGTN
ncbi:hypothetical protein [Haloimpatiens massiliensis]|uniref:hypothetical protein n=1 Tax=Haloimpatiens massiliensis TaxID=1658110 RepID=UPI000C843F95|nr:hypothetical protein [Haloimpatiens massiliensis]